MLYIKTADSNQADGTVIWEILTDKEEKKTRQLNMYTHLENIHGKIFS